MYTYTCIGCIPLQDATGKHGFMMYIYGIIFYRCHVLCAPAALNNHKKHWDFGTSSKEVLLQKSKNLIPNRLCNARTPLCA